ncbi:MAG: hypothetical protein WBN72_08850, partial [Nitrososphaeraceae archaeon]
MFYFDRDSDLKKYFIYSTLGLQPTEEKVRVLGIGSSMRKNSFSTNALRNVLEIISVKYITETRLLNLLETELPIYRPKNRS